MSLACVYVVTLPAVSRSKKQQERERWSLYIRETAGEFHLISANVSVASDCFELSDIQLGGGQFKKVWIDLKSRQITFVAQEMSDEQMNSCFARLMNEFVLRTDSRRMVFMSSARNRKKNSLDTR